MKFYYKNTIYWQQICQINDLTFEFVDQFKVVHWRADHMVRSARSYKQNIAEGATRNSIQDNIQFIGYSRASGEELLEDYRDLAKTWAVAIWPKTSAKLKSLSSYTSLSSLSKPEALNLLIDLTTRTNYLLDQQRRSLETTFIEKGGYTENLARKRREHRGY